MSEYTIASVVSTDKHGMWWASGWLQDNDGVRRHCTILGPSETEQAAQKRREWIEQELLNSCKSKLAA